MAATTLTDKQQRFVEEYLIDLNASAAYRRAGYRATGNAAEVNAVRLLRNAKVQAAIAASRQAQQQRTQITADRVLQEYALLAFSDVGEILDFTQTEPHLRDCSAIPESARRALASIKVKRYLEGGGDDAREVEITEFKLWSKLDALGKLAQHLGLTDSKKPLQVDVTSGGKPLDRNSLTAADITAVAELLVQAGIGVCADGGQESVDPAQPAFEATGVPAAL